MILYVINSKSSLGFGHIHKRIFKKLEAIRTQRIVVLFYENKADGKYQE